MQSANDVNIEQDVIHLSKEKWRWMSDKNVQALDDLFHEKSVYVHMGGAWGKEQELKIIESGGIHYKKVTTQAVVAAKT